MLLSAALAIAVGGCSLLTSIDGFTGGEGAFAPDAAPSISDAGDRQTIADALPDVADADVGVGVAYVGASTASGKMRRVDLLAPEGTRSGDVLVLAVFAYTPGTVIEAPGFFPVRSLPGQAPNAYVFALRYLRVVATTPRAFVLTYPNDTAVGAALLAYRNVANAPDGTPFWTPNEHYARMNPRAVPALGTRRAGARVVTVLGYDTAEATSSWTAIGLTPRAELTLVFAGDAVVGTPGTSAGGSVNAFPSSDLETAGFTFVLEPPVEE